MALTLLEIATAILAGVIGVHGLFTEAKNTRGQVTKEGKVACFLLVMMVLLTIDVNAIEWKLKKDSTADDNARQAKELEQLREELTQPIGDIRAHYMLQMPMDEQMHAYRDRLALEARDGSTAIRIEKGSELAPDEVADAFSYKVLSRVVFKLQIYKTPIDPAKRSQQGADLEREFVSELSVSRGSGIDGHAITHDGPSDSNRPWRIEGSTAATSIARGSGAIRSIPNLKGARAFVSLEAESTVADSRKRAQFLSFRVYLGGREFVLQVANTAKPDSVG